MTRVAITEQYLEDIADAIRAKTGLSTVTYRPSEMASAIATISGGGGITPSGTIEITENGTYNVTSYASADVDVPVGEAIHNQNKTVSPTTSQQSITADSGYTGLGTVTVNAMPAMTLPTSASTSATSGYTSKLTISRSTSDQYINIPTGYNSAGAYYKVNAVANGTATAPASISGSSATVSTGTNTLTLSKTISVTPSISTAGYISSGTAGNSSVSLTASVTTKAAATITPTTTNQEIASGTYLTGKQTISGDANLVSGNIKKNVSIFGVTGSYEASGSSPVIESLSVTPSTSEQTFNSSSVDGYKPVVVAAMSTMTLPTSTSASSTSGYTSKATVSRSTSDQYINIPTGYNSSGAYYKINAVANGSSTSPATISGSSASVSTGTNTLTLSKIISVTPTVSAGYISSGTAGNSSVSLTASVTTKAAATITPTTTNQEIASGTYLTGKQTISGDANLVAGNIKKNVSIFGVTGSYEAGTISPTIDSLSITPSESAQTFNSSSVDGYKPVTVSAISSTYVGSSITQRSSTDLTSSGATVTVPAGYYSSQATKSVSTMTLPTSAASSATSGYTSKATISRSTSAQYINIPQGYNSAGGYYTISAVANGSATGPSSLSGSGASISSGTNTVTLTKTGVVTTPTVSAGYVSSATSSTATVTLTASVTTKAAATITPGTTNQTIASGTYITGTQTIAGDADLVASNIVSGVQIFGVTGNVVLQNYYTGSSAPSSGTGSNGDLYLQS